MTAPKAQIGREEQAAVDAILAKRDMKTRKLLLDARAGDASAVAALLDEVNRKTNAFDPIVGLVTRQANPAQYFLIVTTTDPGGKSVDVRVALGGIEGVASPRQFRNRVGEGLGWFPTASVREWGFLSNALLAIHTDEEPDDDETDAGRAARWVATYLDYYHPRLVGFAAADNAHAKGIVLTAKAWARARSDDLLGGVLQDRRPFCEYDRVHRTEGAPHFFLPSLRLHIRDVSHGSESPTPSELAKALRAAGYEIERTKYLKRPVHPAVDGAETTTSTWVHGGDPSTDRRGVNV